MDKRSLVAERTVRTDKDVPGDSLAEHFDAEHVSNKLLGLAINVRVDKSDIVVAADDVTEGAEALLYTLNAHRIRQGVSEVQEFLIGSLCRDEQAAAVAGGHAADDTSASNGGVCDGDSVSELSFEGGVEVFGAADGNETVGVGEFGEDADLVRVFELGSRSHLWLECVVGMGMEWR